MAKLKCGSCDVVTKRCGDVSGLYDCIYEFSAALSLASYSGALLTERNENGDSRVNVRGRPLFPVEERDRPNKKERGLALDEDCELRDDAAELGGVGIDDSLKDTKRAECALLVALLVAIYTYLYFENTKN